MVIFQGDMFNMALTDISFVSGLTALLIVVTSIAIGLYLFLSYQKSKSMQTLALAATIFSVGWVWSTLAVNFLLASFELDTLGEGDLMYVLIFSWAPAVGLLGTTYLVTSLLKPSLLKPIGFLAVLLSVLDLVVMYVLVPSGQIVTLNDVIKFSNVSSDNLPDASAAGFLQIFSLVAIVTILISGIFFLYTGIKTDIAFVKARGLFMGIGFSSFAVLIIFDTLLALDDIFLILVLRLLIVLVLFIMAIGITLPGFIFDRFGISKPDI